MSEVNVKVKGMEGGNTSCNGTSYLLAFGENSGGLCPMTMMPLLTNSHHATHHPINPNPSNINTTTSNNNNNNNANTNCLFIPNCSNSTGTPSIMLHNNNNTENNNSGLGYYFMESDHHRNNNNNGSSSSSSSSDVKAKIMAHPHYHRLLAAYVNCQKVSQNLQKFKRRKSLVLTHLVYVKKVERFGLRWLKTIVA